LSTVTAPFDANMWKSWWTDPYRFVAHAAYDAGRSRILSLVIGTDAIIHLHHVQPWRVPSI
jgi:hypothetical protein